jgi:Flp pilus assembly protein TadD
VTSTIQKGVSLLQNGRHDEAIDVFLDVLYEEPQEKDALRNLGIAYTEAGRNGEAVRTLDYFLTLWPEDAEALEGLGCSYYRQRAYYKSYELFTKALALHPRSPSILRNLGLAQLALLQPEEGYESLKKARQMNLFDYKSAYAFAAACQKTGRLDEAEEVLTELLQDFLPEEFERTVRRDLESLRRSRLR